MDTTRDELPNAKATVKLSAIEVSHLTSKLSGLG